MILTRQAFILVTIATYILFYLASGAYAAAAACALVHLARPAPQLLTWAHGLALAGSGGIAAAFTVRWVHWGQLPLTTLTDTLSLFTLLAALTMVLTTWTQCARGLLTFYLPALGLVALINAAAAPAYLHTEPMRLQGVLLFAHVGSAFLAYALFFVACVTSAAYVFQAEHLKRRQTTGLFQRLPSLEDLDRILYRLIGVGYPLFVATLLLGLFWAWADRELLGPRWWLAPKILTALLMALFYGVTFHGRRFGFLRGRKLAYVVAAGFAVLLGAYVLLALLGLRTHNFWESA